MNEQEQKECEKSQIPYREGYKAASDGKTILDCPYKDATESEDQWVIGYNDWQQEMYGDIIT